MRFLRVFRLGGIFARRLGHEALAILLADHRAYACDRLRRHIDAVGSHIGDEAGALSADIDALIEPLRDPHGVRRRQPELARGFLLQRRRRERRIRVALDGLGFDRAHFELRGVERLLEVFGLLALADVEPCDLPAVGADEAGDKGLVARCFKMRDQRPIFAADEFFDLQLAFADEAQRDRLHAPGRARAGQLAPQDRRQREADEIVERAAGQIGVDERLVDLAGMRHRLPDRVLGDGVEHHALDGLVLERALLVQYVEQMPGNGLALAIRIGRENDLVGFFDEFGDGGDALGALGVHLPDHREIVFRIDRAVLGRQGRGHGRSRRSR